jgi:molybdopterin molybdotransferase
VVVRELPKARGAFVRARGSDLKTGAVALAAGTSLGPGEIGLLAGLDVVEVDVFRRPRVAVLATGDELRELGEPARPGSIVNSNAHLLAALIRAAGAEPHVLPIARDAPENIAARVREGLQHDVLLTIGGVSVGDYDFVERALRSEGVELAFHKVAIKPGKPILFGTHGARGVPVVGLPGNPVSVMVTFEVFVRPGLLRMAGHAAPYPWPIGVELAEAYEHGHARTELARARLERRGERMIAHLHARQGSGSLPSMTGADVLVILPRNSGRFAAGARVWAIRLGDAPRSSEPPFDD